MLPLEEQNPVWKAHWIWVDESKGYDVILARKTFELEQEEKKARLYISASSIYRLYVNGKYVARGPARSAPHHQYVDAWEIAEFLQKGKNTLAVRVHSQQNKHSYHDEGRSGLFVQLEMAAKTLISDKSWRVSADLSWDSKTPKISRFQQIVTDRVDFRKYAHRWHMSDFDDGKWEYATPLMRNVGWPSPPKDADPIPLTPPWTSLLLRDLPYLKEKKQRAIVPIQASYVSREEIDQGVNLDRSLDKRIKKQWESYTRQQSSLEISTPHKKGSFFILFDLGSLKNGSPQLEIEGEAGTEISILCAPFLVDEVFSHNVVFSDFEDKIILSGKMDSWEATYFKPARYMGILIPASSAPVNIHYAGIRYIEYPFERKGHIRSPQAPWIQAYMDATDRTIKACTTDGYTDNYRERRQYAQTGYYGAMGNYWLFGDHELQRRYLVQVAQEQDANGIMPAYAPLAADDFMIILDSNCLWIRSLRNYLLYSGDYETARHLLPAAHKLMDLLHSYTTELGMINNPPYPYWLDHAQIDRRGANFTLNGHYLGALEDFVEVLNWIGVRDLQTYVDRAQKLRTSLSTELWDHEQAFFSDAYIDGGISNRFSEHTQAMALSLNLGSQNQREQVIAKILEEDKLNYVNRESGMTMVTPAMSYFLHKGLCENGYIDESFDLFRRRFDKMLAPEGNQSLWEEWWLDATGRSGEKRKTSRSDAQTESAFPPALFAEYLLGLRPTEPGMKEILIHLPKTSLENIEAEIPSPEGILKLSWQLGQEEGKLMLEIPGEMQIKLEPESFGEEVFRKMRINGNALKGGNFPLLSAGNYEISF